MKVDFPVKLNHDHTEKDHQVIDPKNWNPTDLTKAPVRQPTEESEEEEYEEPSPVKRQPDEDYDTEDEIEQLPEHLREKIRYQIDANVEKRVKDYMDQFRAEIYDELEDHRVVTQEQIDANIYGAPHQSAGYYPPTGYPKRGGASRSPVRKPKHSFIKDSDYDTSPNTDRKRGVYDKIYEKPSYEATEAARQRLRAKKNTPKDYNSGRKYIDVPNSKARRY